MFRSRLQRALAGDVRTNPKLVQDLAELKDYPIETVRDARAICRALSLLREAPSSTTTTGKAASSLQERVYALTRLFQNIKHGDAPACSILFEHGIPLLLEHYDQLQRRQSEDNNDTLLFMLRIFAMYGTKDGTQRIIEAASHGFAAESYRWHAIFALYADHHPERERLFQIFRESLPNESISRHLLTSANDAAIYHECEVHPFDSDQGVERLQQWFEDADEHGLAHSATASLPFIHHQRRDELLSRAMQHCDFGVRIEAAWAAAKLGREDGLQKLADYCLDIHNSVRAQTYLHELDREDWIPLQAQEPSFRAQARFSEWLAHPNELGEPPDELIIVDHRQLAWPPTAELKPFWLIEFRQYADNALEDDTIDRGLVGSMTWCFFFGHMRERPVEDAYAIHCAWEMANDELIREEDVANTNEYDGMLNQWTGSPLQSPKICKVVELSPKLSIPGRLIAFAEAMIDGEKGWVALDGARSMWYPSSEQPESGSMFYIPKIHIGRQLLGFSLQANRRDCLIPKQTKPAHDMISAYETALTEIETNFNKRPKDLEKLWTSLNRNFDSYLDAKSEGQNRDDQLIALYERLLRRASQGPAQRDRGPLDSLGLIGSKFEEYVKALCRQDRTDGVPQLIELFDPHWQHNLGYGILGAAAFYIGRHDLAEPYLLKIRNGMEQYYRSDAMDQLAEIWFQRGDTEAAKLLLIDCMEKIQTHIAESKHASDQKMYREAYELHQKTLLKYSSS